MPQELDDVEEPSDLVEDDLDALEDDELLDEDDVDEDDVDDDDVDDEDDVGDDDEGDDDLGDLDDIESTTSSPAPATGGEDGDDEDEDEPEDEDVEASLDMILKERLVVEDEVPDEDAVEPDERAEGVDRVLPKQPDEFVCRSCFLVKHPSQLADAKRTLCRDCV